MPRKPKTPTKSTSSGKSSNSGGNFYIDFKNTAQKMAWAAFQQHDVLFLLGPAGVGKSYLSCAFAIEQVLAKQKKKIVLTRPIVEAGETLGYLPGEFQDKVHPYMMPMYDCIDRLVSGPKNELINERVELAPIAYMRGRTFHDSVCIFDEAQNASYMQLKLFLTRFGENSKVIVTGDPNQSDLPGNKVDLMEVVNKLRGVEGIGIVEFGSDSIVRHPLVSKIVDKLE